MPFTLAELATHCPESINLFEKHELDYYQKGKQTLEDACKEKGLDFAKINNELDYLQKQAKKSNHETCLDEFGIEQLINFINTNFHSKEEYALARVDSAIQHLLNNKPQEQHFSNLLSEIEKKFKYLQEELLRHCNHEDKDLFPFIRVLLGLQRNKVNISRHQFPLAKNPVRLLEAEHQQAATHFSEIRRLANDYSVPSNAPLAYKKLVEELKTFEKDLHMHLHIENNILFPKLLAWEEELNRKIK